MLKSISKLFGGSRHDRDLKRFHPLVDEINEHYEQLKSLSDDELKAKTVGFRKIIADETREIEDRIKEIKKKLQEDAEDLDRDVLHDELKEAKKELSD